MFFSSAWSSRKLSRLRLDLEQKTKMMRRFSFTNPEVFGGKTPHPTEKHWSIIRNDSRILAISFLRMVRSPCYPVFLHFPDLWYMKKAANNQEVAQQAVTLFFCDLAPSDFLIHKICPTKETPPKNSPKIVDFQQANADRCLLVSIHERKKNNLTSETTVG